MTVTRSGSGATTANDVLTNLQTIPALTAAGNVTVTGGNGGPFTIVFGNTLAGHER